MLTAYSAILVIWLLGIVPRSAVHCPLLRKYLDTGLTPEDCAEYRKFEDEIIASGKTFGRLIELLNADKEGRVVVLPCKVGGEVYSTLDDLGRLHQCRVTSVFISERSYVNYATLEPVDYEGSQYGTTFGSFGKTVFLTREEAEEALRRENDV